MAFTKCYSISNGQWQWQWNAYDWDNLLKSTTMGLASGFAAGGAGGFLGGIYSGGGLAFLDKKGSLAMAANVSLFYAGKLDNFANTIGSIAGEAVHYAWGGNFRISLGGGVGIGFTTNGQIVNDTSGGIGLVNLVDAMGSLNYVGFQAANVNGGDKGLSRISYVNMGYLSGDMQNMKTAMDVINDKKRIEFNLEGEGNYGYAGEDNRTIHLNREAILADDDAELRAKLAHYTATVMHEGLHLDQHAWLAANGLEADDITLERMAYEQSTKTLALLNLRFGLNVGGSKYEDVAMAGAYFALTGDSDTLDMSGRSLKVKVDGKTTNVTIEDWTNTAKGRSNCIEGMAKALGVTPDKVLEALKRTGHYKGMSDEQIAKSLKVGETLVVRDGRVMTEEEAKGIDFGGLFNGMKSLLNKSLEWMTGLFRGKSTDLDSKLVSTLLSDVVGKPYYKGGGQMEYYPGSDGYPPKQLVNPDGSWAYFDCVGGVMYSIRKVSGLDIPPMGVNVLYSQSWLISVDEKDIREGVLGFYDYTKKGYNEGYWDHVFTIQGKDSNGQWLIITSSSSATQGGPEFVHGKTVSNRPLGGYNRHHEKKYGAIIKYKYIDWSKLSNMYTNN
ncbi:hypothetical protein [Thermospira aquatica]|uniref:Uncharacterized protein n=1 Tax=Thermospira aquatica TaxID=2828656 RepID=A0AAX3BGU1_9SPIR|nr:hypothetical protein [Thermospira aquatica]URA10666.1 hypothetical protein KDW03_02350 [Thermospira aquatica]